MARKIHRFPLLAGWKLRLIDGRAPKNTNRVGLCDPGTKTATAYLRTPGDDPLDTVIHETIHASAPYLDEEAVIAISAMVTLGVRSYLSALKYEPLRG